MLSVVQMTSLLLNSVIASPQIHARTKSTKAYPGQRAAKKHAICETPNREIVEACCGADNVIATREEI